MAPSAGWAHWEWDLTKNKRYSLSSFSKEVVKKITGKVEVTAFIPKPGTFTPQYGQMRQQAQDLLGQYEAANPRLNWRLVDPSWTGRWRRQRTSRAGPPSCSRPPASGKRHEHH